MGIHPVTQAQWKAVMGSNPSHFKGRHLPVESVSWDGCREFCSKLSEREGTAYRLPTQAEWEYACRAGATTPFYFGETIGTDQVNYDGDHPYGQGKKGEFRQKTTPVGTFPPNAWGLYDMHDNVFDWCSDWCGEYPSAESDNTDPQGVSTGLTRVMRGGGWSAYARRCRSADRGRSGPDDRFSCLGIRLARSTVE
jgi:formylglycine-generating enzyme required for sulfatase activity